MAVTNAYMVANLIEKMSNEDRDFRYMALNDLMNELQKENGLSMDEAIEGKVIRAVLNLMEDKNGEVQNLAVKCLGPLVKRIRIEHTLEIIDRLSDYAVQKDNEILRGITSMGLKTVITEVDPVMGPRICEKIIPKLLQMSQSDSYEMQMDALDILAEVLSRFGSQITVSQQTKIQGTLLPLLDHGRAAVRKRTTVAIGYSVVNLTDTMYISLINYLLDRLQNTKNSEKLRTLVQCAGVLSRYSTRRLGGYLPKLLPIIVNHAKEADEDDELREICLQSLESFVLRCPTEITPYINEIIELGLTYLKYDPNFAEDDEDDDGMECQEEEEDEEDEFDEEVDYSDEDDDMSWKVRRSSTKLLGAVIGTRSDLLQSLYETVAPALISRFKEREESVRADVLMTFIALLRQTAVYGGSGGESAIALHSAKSNLYFDATGLGDELSLLPEKVRSSGSQTFDSDMETGEGPKQLLLAQVPKLAKALSKQLSSKSTQTRQIGFILLRELVTVLHGGLSNEIELFIPAIESSLATGANETQHIALTSNLKIEVLTFLRQLFRNHSTNVLHPYLNRLSPPIIRTLSDRFYKITSEAFLLCIELIKVIRPIKRNSETGEYDIADMNSDYKPYILDIYNITIKILGTSDADQEVKERSIMCLGALLAQAGDALQSEQREAWDMFLDRLRNEVTRLITVRTLAIICQSPVAAGSELERCVLVAVDEISLLLRKNNRSLRVASAECLRILIQKFGQHIPNESCKKLLNELIPLISDADLHLLPLALRTIEALIIAKPESVQGIKEATLPSLFQLIQSPLLQGAALDSLLNLFAALARASPADYQILVKGLIDPLLNVKTSGVSAGGVAAVANKQAAATVAQCVAVLAVNTDEANCQNTIRGFQGYIEDASTNDSIKYLSLLALGEIGRRVNLSSIDNIQEHVLRLFAAQSEEVKFAAAFALGNISVGNLERYLPLIVAQIKEQPKRRYLLLHALKEIITRSDKNTKLGAASDEIWVLLIESSDSEQEEGTRSVVAECLGKLALTNTTKFLPELQSRLASPSAHIRATVATAIKYAIVDPTTEYDELLKPTLSQFLSLLQDSSLDVQRLALLTMNSAVHRKPYLIKGMLGELVPLLYSETVVKEELIHTVEMGPFKHKVDDGLEIRKAAYECMYTLLSTCLDKIDVHGFLDTVRSGLEDQHDIKMLAYLMLVRLGKVAPTAVMQKLDELVDPFKATLEFKMRSNAVKQEVEKNQELVRATLRCMVGLAGLSEPGVSPKFDHFIKEVQSGPLADDYNQTLVEANNRETIRNPGDYMDIS
ncbi:armadillo-type protein [Zychaea mexicana]|uniref:armadillo-type protein n=1 Tax=Zychaea mexicana TaxID=64656 RepID=UPI0022FE69EC|nr:armadillo-type protein [Zychaea mexicana]KAI9488039.1 armadillo-type protein [Zychaea mexicana]